MPFWVNTRRTKSDVRLSHQKNHLAQPFNGNYKKNHWQYLIFRGSNTCWAKMQYLLHRYETKLRYSQARTCVHFNINHLLQQHLVVYNLPQICSTYVRTEVASFLKEKLWILLSAAYIYTYRGQRNSAVNVILKRRNNWPCHHYEDIPINYAKVRWLEDVRIYTLHDIKLLV